MRIRGTLRKWMGAAGALALAAVMLGAGGGPVAAAGPTTAWRNGSFVEDTAGVVSRSDVVIQRPNLAPAQYLPLGNGSMGVAAWAAGGFTAQLNRDDTFPDRKSPGQVEISGLAAMVRAPDFTGRLDLYDALLVESGGGMTLRAWVDATSDMLIVDVTGADPSSVQTASVRLWSGRSPAAAAARGVGTLAETWVDGTQTGASGQTFGTLAAITAGGRNVVASVAGAQRVQVTFNPGADGAYRVAVAVPHWAGGDAASTAAGLLAPAVAASESDLLSRHERWWHDFWARTGEFEMTSSDGTAQYMENLRTLYLYTEAASMRGVYGGSQAGVADLFNFSQDHQDWYPSGYWFWNLRGQVSANLSAGDADFNTPLLDMYLNDLPATQAWTRAQMGGLPGVCVPETMRFNGNGFYNGGGATQNASCALASSPSFNAETLTSGAEVALLVWREYQHSGDLGFLRKYYPIMQQSAIFLLASHKPGADGLLHATSNAHETQWAVQDSTTDIAAMQALFPATIGAAALLNTDQTLSAQLATAVKQLPPYARTDAATHRQLLGPAADASGADVIGDSYQPTAPLHNVENVGLEPVWPYDLITDSTVVNGDDMTGLAARTYTHRPNIGNPDWSFDAVQAARLDMPAEVAADLVNVTERFQAYISGMANLFGSAVGDEPYIEQSSTVATALDEALATDYDGTLRVAPAWPSNWDVAGTVSLRNNAKVDVQVQGGTITTAAIVAGASGRVNVRNPWPGQAAEVVDGTTGQVVVAASTSGTLRFDVAAGRSYLVERAASPTTSLPFAAVTGAPALAAKHLGPQQIGLDPAVHFSSLAAAYDNVAITDDANTGPGSFDGNGASFSAQALAAAGAPPGATVAAAGMSFTFPNVPPGTRDDAVSDNQWITTPGSGRKLGLLVSASFGPVTGTGQILYADGTNQSYTVTAPDWFSTAPPAGGAVAVSAAYQNRPGNTRFVHNADIFAVTVPLDPSKPLTAVLLPAVGTLANGTPALHVFAMAVS